MNETGCSPNTGIERGRIADKRVGPQYRVESLTREGVVSRWMPALPRADEQEYAIGDMAYFFMFDDGRGMILGPLTD